MNDAEGPAGPPPGPSAPPAEAAPEAGEAPPEEPQVSLSRDLGFLDATMLGVGALMGGGVFVLLGIAANVAGPALLLSFFLNGLITIPTLMVYAELGSVSSDTGGGYLWVKQAMRQPWGFLGGWMSWFSHAIACAVYALASGFFLAWILNYVGRYPAGWLLGHGVAEHEFIVAAAVGFGALFTLLNYLGVKVSIKTENAITYLVLLVLAVFLSFGLWRLNAQAGLAEANLMDFMPHGFEGVFIAMGITFIAFEGYEIIAQSGEEVRDPGRTIPRAIWASLWIVWPIILLTTVVALGLFPEVPSWRALGAHGPTALVEAARHVMPYGSILIVTCAMLLQIVALNATLYSSSRVSYAMARDHNLPHWFAAVHPRRRTPHRSVVASGLIVILMAATLPIEAVAVAADIQFLLLFLMVNASYMKLRRELPPGRHYKAPLFPAIPLIGIASKAFLAVYLYRYSPLAWWVSGGIAVAGLLLYALYGSRLERRALVKGAAAPFVFTRPQPRKRSYRILVPLTEARAVRGLALAARDIALGRGGEVVFLYAVTLPSAAPLEAGAKFVPEGNPLLQAARAALGRDVPASSIIRIGHDLGLTIRSAAHEEQADLVLVAWRGGGGPGRETRHLRLDALVDNPPCALALVKIADTPPPRRILYAVHPDARGHASLELAVAIARAQGAGLTVLRVLTPGEPGEPAAVTEELRQRVAATAQGARADVEVVAAPRTVAAVLARAEGHDLVVVEEPPPKAWRGWPFTRESEHVGALFAGSVLVVKPYRGRRLEDLRSFFQGFRRTARLLRPD